MLMLDINFARTVYSLHLNAINIRSQQSWKVIKSVETASILIDQWLNKTLQFLASIMINITVLLKISVWILFVEPSQIHNNEI